MAMCLCLYLSTAMPTWCKSSVFADAQRFGCSSYSPVSKAEQLHKPSSQQASEEGTPAFADLDHASQLCSFTCDTLA